MFTITDFEMDAHTMRDSLCNNKIIRNISIAVIKIHE